VIAKVLNIGKSNVTPERHVDSGVSATGMPFWLLLRWRCRFWFWQSWYLVQIAAKDNLKYIMGEGDHSSLVGRAAISRLWPRSRAGIGVYDAPTLIPLRRAAHLIGAAEAVVVGAARGIIRAAEAAVNGPRCLALRLAVITSAFLVRTLWGLVRTFLVHVAGTAGLGPFFAELDLIGAATVVAILFRVALAFLVIFPGVFGLVSRRADCSNGSGTTKLG
jgi:hypothetical protein